MGGFDAARVGVDDGIFMVGGEEDFPDEFVGEVARPQLPGRDLIVISMGLVRAQLMKIEGEKGRELVGHIDDFENFLGLLVEDVDSFALRRLVDDAVLGIKRDVEALMGEVSGIGREVMVRVQDLLGVWEFVGEGGLKGKTVDLGSGYDPLDDVNGSLDDVEVLW